MVLLLVQRRFQLIQHLCRRFLGAAIVPLVVAQQAQRPGQQQRSQHAHHHRTAGNLPDVLQGDAVKAFSVPSE